MPSLHHLAIIGSGPSAIYLLKHLRTNSALWTKAYQSISIFERTPEAGMGMPYHPATTDKYNLSNISSAELPALEQTLVEWLRAQPPSSLASLGMPDELPTEEGIYSRLVLGRYLQEQYRQLSSLLKKAGIQFNEFPETTVTDLVDCPAIEKVQVVTADGRCLEFDRVVIATGHIWSEPDTPEAGYYASPWPIAKILPEEHAVYNFRIGTLGASLSAFDVISSLAHRHGNFVQQEGVLVYHPHPGTGEFGISMHSTSGTLPHLQFDLAEPLRDIYRPVSREALLDMMEPDGRLSLQVYYDKVCRPALQSAFFRDGLPEQAALVADGETTMEDFLEKMADRHDYQNAFEGMKCEMVDAVNSVENHRPIHWKETLDDLFYTLNYHAELLSAEDHIALKSKVMPFLMNVIAAMPLPSARILLALYDAGKIDIISGRVSVEEIDHGRGITQIKVEHQGVVKDLEYRLFVDCSGQKPLDAADYPFPSLTAAGTVRPAMAKFQSGSKPEVWLPPEKHSQIFRTDQAAYFLTGGIDIDGLFRVIGSDGAPNLRIQDIAFTHVPGVRPYSYGLQACHDTSAIVVQAWSEEVTKGKLVQNDTTALTAIYEEISAEPA